MALSAGTRFGSYEIVAPLGAGGMGEVYRAKDTKLKREVAVKVLPGAFASDPERMARFRREAELLAALNHPNIAAIYGFESGALIMELIEGETLSRSLPMDTALRYARQIAEALEFAHERGVIHRDLKPANVKVTSEDVVKLLDFGLAKAIENPSTPGEDPENSPTMTLGMTATGVIMGTAAYMSPEQAIGKTSDRRADIWSFGVVLFEILSGKRAFAGDSAAETLASVLKLDPDWNALPASTPAPIRALLKRCLRKDRKQRLQAIGEARIAIDDVLAGRSQTEVSQPAAGRRWSVLPWIAAGILGLAGAAGWWTAWQSSRQDHPLLRLSDDLGPNALSGINTTAAISPDGTRLVFLVRGAEGKTQLATRLLEQSQVTVLSGTEGASDPFFKPDGEWIGFFADGQMKKVAARGSAVIILCAAHEARGAAWGDDGTIIATLDSNTGVGLSRVSENGGIPQSITDPGANHEATHRWPQFLPGGQSVLFMANKKAADYDESTIDILTLKTGEVKEVLKGGYFPRYFPTSKGAGYVIYVRQGNLFGVRFDLDHMEVQGNPVPLLDDLAGDANTAGGQFDVSRDGTLVYLSGKATSGTWTLAWLDADGKTQPLLATPALYYQPTLSPDGTQLAFSNGTDIHTYDLNRATQQRLNSPAQTTNFFPIWTGDGKHIIFQSQGTASWSLRWIRADGTGELQTLLESKNRMAPTSISPDGKRLAFSEESADMGWDLFTLALDTRDPERPKAGQPELFVRTSVDEQQATFSPDGRWIAYTSAERASGNSTVYVLPFTLHNESGSGKMAVSTRGGQLPIWGSRELFYLAPDNRIMSSAYTIKGDSFTPRNPQPWSSLNIGSTSAYGMSRTSDGKRFVIARLPASESSALKESVHITFLLNFFDEVRRRIPSRK